MSKKRYRAKELRQPSPEAGWTPHADGGDEGGRPAKPRSKAEKSDEPAIEGPEHEATVISTWSGGCRVRSPAGEHDCVLPSALAAEQKSLVAVGDRARCVGPTQPGAPWRLVEVLPRSTRLARPHPLNPRIERVIAANVTRVVQVSAVVRPALRPALIDRYLIAIEQSGAKPILCVNKIDLLDADARARELAVLDPYRELGLPIVLTSARTGEGLDELRALLQGELTVVVGHSGVGKSSLLNALAPEFAARTAEVSQAWQKGRHTTTRASLYESADGLRLIDTPGIRELGLLDLDAEGLRAFFPDLEELALGCRFNDCRHRTEPDCAVRAAAEESPVVRARLATYQRIAQSLEDTR